MPKINFAIEKYIKIPKISFPVVINGPVATAGSTPLLSKKTGIKVPINAAIIITDIRATQRVIDIK